MLIPQRIGRRSAVILKAVSGDKIVGDRVRFCHQTPFYNKSNPLWTLFFLRKRNFVPPVFLQKLGFFAKITFQNDQERWAGYSLPWGIFNCS